MGSDQGPGHLSRQEGSGNLVPVEIPVGTCGVNKVGHADVHLKNPIPDLKTIRISQQIPLCAHHKLSVQEDSSGSGAIPWGKGFDHSWRGRVMLVARVG